MKKFAILFLLLFPFALNAQDWVLEDRELKIVCMGGYIDEQQQVTPLLATASFTKIHNWIMIVSFFDKNANRIDISNSIPQEPHNIAAILTTSGISVSTCLTSPFSKAITLTSTDNFSQCFEMINNGEILDVIFTDNANGGYFLTIPKDENFATLFEQYEKQIKK